MKELYKLFAQGKTPLEIKKEGLSTYSLSNLYWHSRKSDKDKSRFIFVSDKMPKPKKQINE